MTSLFYSLSPDVVERHTAPAWRVAAPERVLAARGVAVDRALRRLLGDHCGSPELREAAELARRAAEAAGVAGPAHGRRQRRAALAHGAARGALARGHRPARAPRRRPRRRPPGPPSRARRVPGLARGAVGAAPPELFCGRQWSDTDWAAARARLADRGLVRADGRATDEGLRVRASVEKLTDQLAAAPWDALAPDELTRLSDLLTPPVLTLVGSGLLPARSTLGIGMTYDYA